MTKIIIGLAMIPLGLLCLGAMGALMYALVSLPWAVILVITGHEAALSLLILDVAILSASGVLMAIGGLSVYLRERLEERKAVTPG